MYKNQTVVVVVPAFNEKKLVGRGIETMPDFVDRIVVVDDCSTDGTVRVVEGYQKDAGERIKLIRHDDNKGVGGAIASGYEWARDNDFDVAVVMAGDAQMNPRDLPDLLDPVVEGRVDYAKGDRLTGRINLDIIPKARLWGNSILSFLTKIASGYWHVVDSQSGYTAINKRALNTLVWGRMYRRYGQPNHLLVMLNVHNFRVADVQIEPVYNVGEVSGLNIKKSIVTISWLLLRSFVWRLKEKYVIRDFHPLVFFYLLGIGMTVLSIFFFGRLIVLWVQNSFVPGITFLAWMFSSIVGLQSIFFAMWFDMEYNRHLRG